MGLGPGDEIAGYRLTHELGEGGMGCVWAAERDGKTFALKFLSDEPADPEAARKRMLREAKAAQSVDHPHVVTVHEVIALDDGAPVIVMELLEGESLADRIARDKPMAVADVAEILLPVISAVGAAHAQGVVHRDLKPANIFLTEDGVKVLDFGIAKRVASDGEDTAITVSGAMLGTPCYMAPEQAFGETDIDDRADIWALGIIAYEALSGLLPTKADNVGQVLKIVLTRQIWPLADAAPDVPGEVAAMVDRMLSRERHDRPTLAEVRDVFRHHADVQIPPLAASRVQRASALAAEVDPEVLPSQLRSTPSRPAWRWLVVVAVAGSALAWWQLRPTAASETGPEAVLIPSGAPSASAPAPDEAEAPQPSPAPVVAPSSASVTSSSASAPRPPKLLPASPPDEFDPLKQRR